MERPLKNGQELFLRCPPFTDLLRNHVSNRSQSSFVSRLPSSELGTPSFHTHVFPSRPLFSCIRQACSVLVKLMRSSTRFQIVLRVMRCVSVLVKEYHRHLQVETEVFITLVFRMLDQGYPMWHRMLSLEAIHAFCLDPEILYFLFSSFDERPPSSPVS